MLPGGFNVWMNQCQCGLSDSSGDTQPLECAGLTNWSPA